MRATVASCASLTVLRASGTMMTDECREEPEKILALRRKPEHPELAPPFRSSPPSGELSIGKFL